MNETTAIDAFEVVMDGRVASVDDQPILTVDELRTKLEADRTSGTADIQNVRDDAIIRGVVVLAEASGHGDDEYLRQFLDVGEYGLARDDLVEYLLSDGLGLPSEAHRDLLAKVDYLLAIDLERMGAVAHDEVREVVAEIDAFVQALGSAGDGKA